MSVRRAGPGDAVVGQNIRVHRLARRMSQTELADGIGVTFQQVQKYENGANRVGAARLVRIAEMLHVPVDRLLEGVDTAKVRDALSPVALIAQRQPLRLVQAYAAIGDRRLRRSLLDLAEGIARVMPRARG
jgi:transcriptional regulator with XRE-family HTH domain